MRFENPAWLALLAIIPVLTIAFIAGERRASQNLKRFASVKLLPALNRSALWPRIVRHILIVFAVALIVVALARPSYGYRLREIHSKGADIIFAVDVSRSMLCADITPDRLTRAKLAARDILDTAKGHRIGVVPFAGEAFLQCPLTLDADAVRQSIDALDATSIPSAGTSLAQPIAEAREAFGTGENKKILVILSDGEDLEGTGLKEARATQGVTIVTIGMGTTAGAPVPVSAESGAAYERDAYGKIVTSRMDSSGLESVASATGGFYERAGSPSLVSDFKDLLDKNDDKDNAKTANLRIPIIRYRWPLAIALILLAAESLMPSFRKRGGAIALLIALALPLSPNDSQAQEATPPPTSADVAPAKAPARKQNDKAAVKEARESYNKGVAAYNKDDYDKAAQEFLNAIEKNGGRNADLARQASANAGAAKLAQAEKLIPTRDDDEISLESYDKTKKLLDESKTYVEKAMSLAPDDKMLRRNYAKIEEAEKNLEKHKQKPEKDEQQKKDDGLPTQQPQEQNPPQKQDQDQKQDDKNRQNDKNQQNGSGGSSGSSDQNDKQNQQQQQGGGSSGSGSQNDKQNQNQQQQQGGSSGSSSQNDKQNQNQQQQQQQQQSGSSGSQSDKQDQNNQQQQQQGGGSSQSNTSENNQKQERQQNKSGSSGENSRSDKQDRKEQSQSGGQSGAQDRQDKAEEKQPQQQSAGNGQQQEKQAQEEKQPSQGASGSGENKAEKDKQPQTSSQGEGKQADKQDQPQPKSDNMNSGGQSAEKKQEKPDEKNASGGASASEQQRKDEEKKDKQSAAGASAQKQDEKSPAEKKNEAGAASKDDKSKENKENAPQTPKPAANPQAKPGDQQKAPEPEKNEEKKTGAASKNNATTAKSHENEDKLIDSETRDNGLKAANDDLDKDKVRREGDHTKLLERPDENQQQNDNPEGEAAASDASAPQGNKSSGQMTPQDAEQLLRILQKDEKFLPAGQTKEQSESNPSGRDW